MKLQVTCIAVLALIGLMAACGRKEPPPTKTPFLQGVHSAEQYPITHGYSNFNPSQNNWEITDPKFAYWIEQHCHIVKAEPGFPPEVPPKYPLVLKCDTDKHSDIIGND